MKEFWHQLVLVLSDRCDYLRVVNESSELTEDDLAQHFLLQSVGLIPLRQWKCCRKTRVIEMVARLAGVAVGLI